MLADPRLIAAPSPARVRAGSYGCPPPDGPRPARRTRVTLRCVRDDLGLDLAPVELDLGASTIRSSPRRDASRRRHREGRSGSCPSSTVGLPAPSRELARPGSRARRAASGFAPERTARKARRRRLRALRCVERRRSATPGRRRSSPRCPRAQRPHHRRCPGRDSEGAEGGRSDGADANIAIRFGGLVDTRLHATAAGSHRSRWVIRTSGGCASVVR